MAADNPKDKTPDEWRALEKTPAYEFAPAELLHRWRTHALHANAPKRMSRETYLRCIEAAKQPGDDGEYAPDSDGVGDYEADGTLSAAQPRNQADHQDADDEQGDDQ